MGRAVKSFADAIGRRLADTADRGGRHRGSLFIVRTEKIVRDLESQPRQESTAHHHEFKKTLGPSVDFPFVPVLTKLESFLTSSIPGSNTGGRIVPFSRKFSCRSPSKASRWWTCAALLGGAFRWRGLRRCSPASGHALTDPGCASLPNRCGEDCAPRVPLAYGCRSAFAPRRSRARDLHSRLQESEGK
jgi:hypothetical protein